MGAMVAIPADTTAGSNVELNTAWYELPAMDAVAATRMIDTTKRLPLTVPSSVWFDKAIAVTVVETIAPSNTTGITHASYSPIPAMTARSRNTAKLSQNDAPAMPTVSATAVASAHCRMPGCIATPSELLSVDGGLA